MSEYKRFIKVWECIHKMNTQGIFDYGYARQDGGGKTAVFLFAILIDIFYR